MPFFPVGKWEGPLFRFLADVLIRNVSDDLVEKRRLECSDGYPTATPH